MKRMQGEVEAKVEAKVGQKEVEANGQDARGGRGQGSGWKEVGPKGQVGMEDGEGGREEVEHRLQMQMQMQQFGKKEDRSCWWQE